MAVEAQPIIHFDVLPSDKRVVTGAATDPASAEARLTMRNVVVHYHFFKNAGTSIDKMLQESFTTGWRSIEKDNDYTTGFDLSQYIVENAGISAISSHTALFPVPDIAGTVVWPIFFLRHPIARILSVYDFERKQGDLTDGSRVAGSKSLGEYLSWRLSRHGDRTISDFHVFRLSRGTASKVRVTKQEELDEAKSILDRSAFFGIVERFDQSIFNLERWLSTAFPNIRLQSVHKNIT